MKNMFIDNRCLGSQMLLVDVRPIMYDGTTRLSEPSGYNYDVCLPAQAFEKLAVKIPGEALMSVPSDGYIEVKFEGLEVRPYVRDKFIAYSASAKSVHPVEKGKA